MKIRSFSLKRNICLVIAAGGLTLGFAACSNGGNPTPTHQPNNHTPSGTVPKPPGSGN